MACVNKASLTRRGRLYDLVPKLCLTPAFSGTEPECRFTFLNLSINHNQQLILIAGSFQMDLC